MSACTTSFFPQGDGSKLLQGCCAYALRRARATLRPKGCGGLRTHVDGHGTGKKRNHGQDTRANRTRTIPKQVFTGTVSIVRTHRSGCVAGGATSRVPKKVDEPLQKTRKRNALADAARAYSVSDGLFVEVAQRRRMKSRTRAGNLTQCGKTTSAQKAHLHSQHALVHSDTIVATPVHAGTMRARCVEQQHSLGGGGLPGADARGCAY